jgi:hypothetical protein
MAMAVLGLALYLWLLGKWGKHLKTKNTPLGRRRLYGILASLLNLLAPFSYWYDGYRGGWFMFMLLYCFVVAILGFITVAYAPAWIVGTPKPVENPTAK